MSKLIESSEYLHQQLQDLAGSFSALEQAAERITMHNIKLRVFLMRLVDSEDLGHAVTNEVRQLANELLTMERDDVGA